ncbi:MAG: aminopeptidase P family protein, partial [Bacilli bacterium]|nr:aminopeptidase P family protein [Bacilli bacterium]
NIAVDVSPHGPGVNIDNYESHDTREIIDGVTFSLEPGIYAPDFGMRSETNVYIKNRQPIYVAGHQEEIIAILKD